MRCLLSVVRTIFRLLKNYYAATSSPCTDCYKFQKSMVGHLSSAAVVADDAFGPSCVFAKCAPLCCRGRPSATRRVLDELATVTDLTIVRLLSGMSMPLIDYP